MPELSAVLHEISVAFGCSNNLRTLTLRLADAMGRHLPIAEIETVRLIEHRGEVGICAYAPGNCRRWDGCRSARFLARQEVVAPIFVTDELARVAIAPVAEKLKLPVGRAGILAIAFETEISVFLGSRESTEILVDVLALHCLRLGQLLATASRCRAAHHRKIGTGKSVVGSDSSHRKNGTDITVAQSSPTRAESHTPPPSQRSTEVSVSSRSTDISVVGVSTDISVDSQATEISVETVDAALIRCISTALDQSRGKIYGRGGAAELLGLKPSTLQSKMRKLGIDRAEFAY